MEKAAYAKCSKCPLEDKPFCPTYVPNNYNRIVVIGEAPGANEVREKIPFVGQSGQLMKGVFNEVEGDWEGVARTNVVLCRPPNNREPTSDEIACCSQRLIEDLTQLAPQLIMPLGKVASECITGQDASITALRGEWHTYDNIAVMPTWHPAYVLRQPHRVTELLRDTRIALNRGGTAHRHLHKCPPWEWVHTPEDLAAIMNEIPEGSLITFDFETDNVVWYDKPTQLGDAALMLGFRYVGSSSNYIVPMDLLYDSPETTYLLNCLFDDFGNYAGHNAGFDVLFGRRVGINKARFTIDTLLAKYCLDELPPHGLKEVAKNEYGIHDYEQELVQVYLRSRNDRYSKVPPDNLAAYCGWDNSITEQYAVDSYVKIKEQGMWEWPYKNLLIPLQQAYTDMEHKGMMVDVPYLEKARDYIQAELDDWTQKMRDACGRPELNPDSTQQMATVLWDDYELPVNKRAKVYRKTPRSTSQEAVEHLASYNPKTHVKVRNGHFFVDLLMAYRRAKKMQSSYILNLLAFADVEGRVHPSGKAWGTEVGRAAFSGPATNTTPRPSDVYGAIIRAAYIPAPGHVFVDVDYSQAELRVFAALAGAKYFLRAYEEGLDIHGIVAEILYGKGWTREHRVHAKMFDFAYIYGGNEYSFATDAGMPIDVARRLVRRFDTEIPEGKQFRKKQFKLMLEQGYVQTRFGRKRRCELVTRANRNEIMKASMHMPVASSAHDLTALSLIRLWREGYPVVMEVHDSIILEVPVADAEDVSRYTQQVMLETARQWFPEVTWEVDADVKNRWSPLPDLKL